MFYIQCLHTLIYINGEFIEVVCRLKLSQNSLFILCNFFMVISFFSESMNAISSDQPGKIFNLQLIKLDFANKHEIGMK